MFWSRIVGSETDAVYSLHRLIRCFTYCLIDLSPYRQNDHHFADGILKCISLNEALCILIPTSLKFVSKGPINNKSELVHVKA